jgi:phage terminase small subunit
MAEGLTIKQDRFARQYVKDGNGTRAAIAAGYAQTGAHVQSSENLRKPKVAAAIAALRRRQAERLDVSREKMINDAAHFAEQAAAKEEFGPAIKATELIMKAQGYLVERSLNVSVDVTQNHLDALMQYTDQRVDDAVRRATTHSHAEATDVEEQPGSPDVHDDLS